MTKILLVVSLSLQAIALGAVTVSKRISPELRGPIRVLLLGLSASVLIQWTGEILFESRVVPPGFLLASLVILASAATHFLLALATPRFIRSSNYWCFQAAMGLALLIAISLTGGSTSPGMLAHFSMIFGWLAIGITGMLLMFALFLPGYDSTSATDQFRLRSARKLFLWSLALSLLLIFSLPAAPAAATATAAWCTCFATIGTRYVISERRLFLYDCARQALAAPGGEVPDESIELAASTIDSLGALMSVGNTNGNNAIVSKIRQELSTHTLGHLIASGRIGSPETIEESQQRLLDRIHDIPDSEDEFIFEQLLTADERSSFIVPLASIRPRLSSIASLSQSHFNIDLIGTSYQLMEIINRLRDDGSENRTTVISGEPGTGKQLIARALHSLRGGQVFHHLPLSNSTDFNEIETIVEAQKQVDTEFVRHTLAVSAKAEQLPALNTYLEKLRLSLFENTNFIVLLEEATPGTEVVATGPLADSFRIHIPPLRERFEDIVYQSFWYAERLATEMNLQLAGLSAQALRAALIYPWSLNSEELIDSLRIALSLESNIVDGVLQNFVLPPLNSTAAKATPWARTVQGEMQKIFDQMQGDASLIASHLQVSVPFVYQLAGKLKLSLLLNSTEKIIFS